MSPPRPLRDHDRAEQAHHGIAAIGEAAAVCGFAFAGVQVLPAEDAATALAAWRALPEEVSLLILTSASHALLERELPARAQMLCAVLGR